MDIFRLRLIVFLGVVNFSDQSQITLKSLNESGNNAHNADLERRLVDGMLNKGNEAMFKDLKMRRQLNRAFLRVNQDQVLFKLYRQNSNESYNLLTNDPKNLQGAPLDKSLQTDVIIHGWINDGDSEFPMLMKNTLLQEKDRNLIVVDWSQYTVGVHYPKSVVMTSDVGQIVGDVLSDLVNLTYVERSTLHVMGHSLGAHVSGFAGKRFYKNLGEKIQWITGLDPALPLFEQNNPENRLDSSDADYVDIIHTCGSMLGYIRPIGHIDFYPNGGVLPQPGCSSLSVIGVCAHSRAYKYYVEALITPSSFIGFSCPNEIAFNANKCWNLKDAKRMGELYPGGRNYGKFFLETKGSFPFHIESFRVADLQG